MVQAESTCSDKHVAIEALLLYVYGRSVVGSDPYVLFWGCQSFRLLISTERVGGGQDLVEVDRMPQTANGKDGSEGGHFKGRYPEKEVSHGAFHYFLVFIVRNG